MNTKNNTTVTKTDTETLASLFHRAAHLIMRTHHHHGNAEHAQMRILSIIKDNEPMSQKKLLDELGIRSASLSELLGKLERRGLISRSRDVQDKRNLIISCTKEGSSLVKSIKSTRKESFDDIFSVLSESEQEQLAKLLSKLFTSMERHLAEHHPHHDHKTDHRHSRRHIDGRKEDSKREQNGRHYRKRGELFERNTNKKDNNE